MAGLDSSYNELSSSVIALTSLKNSRENNLSTSTPQVSFNYPTAGDKLTAGCLYNIRLTSSTTLNSLALTLMDAENDEPIDTKSSGLATTTTLGKLKQIPWTVGELPDSEYYLSLSKVNDLKVSVESGVFSIKESLDPSDPSNSCQE